MRLHFRILGPLEVRAEDVPLPLGGRRQRAVLAILLLNAGRVVSRDRLIDDLWGEDPPATASHTLDAYVSRLRKLLDGDGEGRLVTQAPGYLLRLEPGDVDLDRFERLVADARAVLDERRFAEAAEALREADELWRGRPLAELEFEPFAQAPVERLVDLRLAAIEDRVEAELALGLHRPLVGELSELVEEHPLRERLRGQLMLALYRAGRQADALEVFRSGRTHLVDELGLEPGPALRELEQAILVHDPALDAPGGLVATVMPRTRRGRIVAAVGAAVATAFLVVAWPFGSGPGPVSIEGNAVAVVDTQSGAVSDAIELDGRPGSAALAAGSIWMTMPDAGSVVRIDPGSRAVRQTITVGGGPSAVAAGAGAVWVARYFDGRVSRIDPEAQRVVQTIRVGSGPGAIGVDGRFVWVANTVGSSVVRLSASTGMRVDVTPLPSRPTALAVGAAGVWVASASANRVLRLDPVTGKVTRTIAVGTGPSAIVATGGAVWVANRFDGTVSRIDPRRGIVTDTIAVGNAPNTLAVGPRSLWVGNERDGTVSDIDLVTRRVTRTVRVSAHPQAMVAGPKDLFVGATATGAAHRGGTLRLVQPAREFDTLDPALLISVNPAQLLGLTNDGLLTYNHAGGTAGLQLVPDLALSIPRPIDRGTAYRFHVRRGVRYSTGKPVRARDFRWAIERAFRLDSTGAPFYRGILGAPACARDPSHCDLSRGIVTDDAARTVTFHLREPDPDFLQKLALPYTFAVPAGAAPREAHRVPLPATGPYRITTYRPGRELVLTRNPRFHEWSGAAQPAGYPDSIVWKLGMTLDRALVAIERGRADWVLNYGPLPPDRRRELRTRFASQTHTNLVPFTYYYFMNTRRPPFDDVRVRRALNYALDRKAMARIYGAPPTCSLLPPQLPGYSRSCPYHTDLARARRLIAASGTKGMRVRVINDVRTRDQAFIVRLLKTLGYRASPWIVPGRAYGLTISDSRRGVQIGNGGWNAEYPATSALFDSKLSCRAWRPANPFNNDDSEFCDPRIDAEAERARRLGLTGPDASTRAWQRVYRDILDQAPWLPTVTPTWTDFVSRRVGNYQFHPLWGILPDQLWVR
jgi:YVTN family beta-propeller protein